MPPSVDRMAAALDSHRRQNGLGRADTDTRSSPSRRAFVLHRLAAVASNGTRPGLAAMAAELQTSLRDRWGAVPLELAPAFRRTR